MSAPQEEITQTQGDGVIQAEQNTAIIEHGLGVKPEKITITGIPGEYFSFVVNDDAQSFQVCLHVPATQDIAFHWEAAR